MDQEDDYKVGYGKPPRATQFRRGSSGNPKGRPKASKGPDSHLMQELSKLITVTENGQRRRISKSRALYMQLVNKAISGDPTSTRIVSRHLERVQLRLDAVAASQPVEPRMRAIEELSDEELTAMIRSCTDDNDSDDQDG